MSVGRREPPERPAANTGVAPPHSLAAEQSVLGAILIAPNCLPGLTRDGLLAEHFYRDRHRAIYAAMLALDGRGDAIDVLTVTVELEQHGRLQEAGGRAAIDELTGGVPGLGAVRRYARIVVEHWQARQTLAATYMIQTGIASGDPEAVEEGRRMLDATTVAPGVTDGYLGAGVLGSHMFDWMAAEPDEGLPTPVDLPSLAGMIRLRPGHMTILAAWPSCGKTAVAMALAAATGRRKHRTVIWTNEDTAEELAAKHVCSVTGIPASVISDRRVTDHRMARVVAEFGRLPFEVQPCHDWTAEQVAAHIRQVRPAVAIVDHFHNLSRIGTTSEVDESIRVLAAAAGQTGCHLVMAAQLNRARMSGVCKPPPVAADLRGSGMFLAACHTMLLVHRDEEEIDDDARGKTGQALQLDTGSVMVAKNKVTGKTGLVRVVWDVSRLRFVEPARGRDFVEPSPGSVEDVGF